MVSKTIEHCAVSRETPTEAVKAVKSESESKELSRMRRKEEQTTKDTKPEEKGEEESNSLGLRLQKRLLDNDRVIGLLSIPILGAVVAMGLLAIIGTGYLIDAVKSRGKDDTSKQKS